MGRGVGGEEEKRTLVLGVRGDAQDSVDIDAGESGALILRSRSFTQSEVESKGVDRLVDSDETSRSDRSTRMGVGTGGGEEGTQTPGEESSSGSRGLRGEVVVMVMVTVTGSRCSVLCANVPVCRDRFK